ncbi:hypothetical protein QMZ92_24330 [Streptomyces sp. HNM0645]|uniref:hypothetical protein n=1 Tax=Streptomyces sp. HNM0645 TaxID=2782343 RepID=UPI0024B77472|nr:hypothetical protein [Streptomyces sp. HNM0645]MDI9887414.1 hypothetical protein [Streptomyces sp. HNM0645]
MNAASVPFQEILQNPDNYSHDDFARARAEKVLAVSATLLHQRGHEDIAALLAQADFCDLEYQEEDWGKPWFEVVLDLDHPQLERFTEEVQQRALSAMQEVCDRENFGVSGLRARAILPEVGANWREQLAAGGKARPSNHARKVRIGQAHPQADGLHLTNEWEWRVYAVLRERQQELPDNDTIGIVPLSAMKVRDHVFEPDLLVTYRGYVGVIEVDGPHHKGRSSDDKSRERLLRHAGVKYIDRIDVRDASAKEEVEKFVTDFLRHLIG